MTVLVLGANGQVGRAWTALLGNRALAFPRAKADLSDPDFIPALEKKTSRVKLTAVVNAAAYTQVEKAEGEGRVEAFRINAEAVGELAAWCRERGVPLVHYSTDYVFGDNGTKPHREDDQTAPLNIYGQSKLGGEKMVAASGAAHLIFRTSWVYDAEGKNFVNTMLKLFHEREELKIVADQVGAPTYAPQLAEASLFALDRALESRVFPTGIYHLCHGGETSWCEFAASILTLARGYDSGIKCERILPIPTSARPSPVNRPLNSRLSCVKAHTLLGVRLPPWEEGLKACFEEKYGSAKLPHRGSQGSTA